MIRAIIRKGRIHPLDQLPAHWQDGQELIVDACAPPDDAAAIKRWYARLQVLSAGIPPRDHERIADALAEQDRQSKELVRREIRN